MRLPFHDDPLIAARYVVAGGPADPADLIDLIERLAEALDWAEQETSRLEAEVEELVAQTIPCPPAPAQPSNPVWVV